MSSALTRAERGPMRDVRLARSCPLPRRLTTHFITSALCRAVRGTDYSPREGGRELERIPRTPQKRLKFTSRLYHVAPLNNNPPRHATPAPMKTDRNGTVGHRPLNGAQDAFFKSFSFSWGRVQILNGLSFQSRDLSVFFLGMHRYVTHAYIIMHQVC